MAKQKYYAVKQGRVPGVYLSWDEAKEQVSGYSGAEYKSFSSMDDATSYMGGQKVETTPVENKGKPKKEQSIVCGIDKPYAFVDGSFNPDTKTYGYGGFLCVNGRTYPLEGSDNREDMADMRNVAGEISGAVAAVKKAEELHLSDMVMLYDYNGVEAWATNSWKANKIATKAYAQFMQSDKRTVNVEFQHVKGHTGIEGNEMADVMAKHAVGVGLTPKQQTLYDSVFENDVESRVNDNPKSNAWAIQSARIEDEWMYFTAKNNETKNVVVGQFLIAPQPAFPDDVRENELMGCHPVDKASSMNTPVVFHEVEATCQAYAKEHHLKEQFEEHQQALAKHTSSRPLPSGIEDLVEAESNKYDILRARTDVPDFSEFGEDRNENDLWDTFGE